MKSIRIIYAIAFNICKNVQDAEDVVQDTFISYISLKKDFESDSHIRAWLIRVAINKAIVFLPGLFMS